MICSVCGADVTADFGSDVSTGVTCRHIACAAHVTPRVDHPVLGVVCACPASGCKGLHAPFTIPPGPDDTSGQAAAVGEGHEREEQEEDAEDAADDGDVRHILVALKSHKRYTHITYVTYTLHTMNILQHPRYIRYIYVKHTFHTR